MKSLKPVLLLVLVFATGVVCGSVGTRATIRYTVRTALKKPETVWTRLEKRMVSDLDLTKDQRAKAGEVLANARRQLQQLRTENRPKYRAVIEKVQSDLNVFLTPEQRTKLEKLRAQRPLLRLAEETGP